MSDHQTPSHDAWDELAAGYALHALEPDEELRFVEHLATCEECATLLRDHELVAAQLGALAHDEDDEFRAPEWSAIRASVVDLPPPVSLDERRRPARRQPWILGAAAVVVLLAGAGVAVWQTRDGSTSPGTQAIRSCQHQSGCAVVRLHGSTGPDPAIVLVSHDSVTMVPLAMKPPAAGSTYVLWQLLRSGAPTAVTSFSNASGPSDATLVMPYADTAAFAISVEPASVPPAQPTHVVAIGNTSA
jgi:anti-sigma-K factor RskA